MELLKGNLHIMEIGKIGEKMDEDIGYQQLRKSEESKMCTFNSY